MTEPSGGGGPANGQRSGERPGGVERRGDAPGESWEQRAAGLASEIQRWLIRTSARNMRDELGDHVKKAFRGSESASGDSWSTATTEPPHAADEAPECAWCPVCRAARRIAQTRAGGAGSGGPRLSDAADVVAGAVRDALANLDSILAYRPGEAAPGAPPGRPRSAESSPEPPHAQSPRAEGPQAEAPQAGAPRAEPPAPGSPAAEPSADGHGDEPRKRAGG